MNTKPVTDSNDLIRNRQAISVRLPDDLYRKIKERSKCEHRSLGPQCAVLIERQLALEESKNNEKEGESEKK
jgi:hypothetical protein